MMRWLPIIACFGLAIAGCGEGERYNSAARTVDTSGENFEVALVDLSPAGNRPVTHPSVIGKEYENSPEHIIAGQHLFKAMNCVGCHSSGGGGMGPPLMDKAKNGWLYGGTIDNITSTIMEGRPNGMPSFRGRIVDQQVWELAAYVKSLSKKTEER